MQKPNARLIDYTALVQDGVMEVQDVPQDIQEQVIKLVRYFDGITDEKAAEPEPLDNQVPVKPDKLDEQAKPLQIKK